VPRGIQRPRNMNEAVDTVRKLPTYARLVWDLARDPRVPRQQKLVLGALAAYLAFPIDIIPDFIPVIGQMDDVAAIIFVLNWFVQNAPPDVVEEHMTRIARHDDVLSKDLESAGSLLASRASELRATLERFRSKREAGGDE
jgi:uncharacterized membrane protein YkvA (DUF1232 family)